MQDNAYDNAQDKVFCLSFRTRDFPLICRRKHLRLIYWDYNPKLFLICKKFVISQILAVDAIKFDSHR